jgi:hypothetical protein
VGRRPRPPAGVHAAFGLRATTALLLLFVALHVVVNTPLAWAARTFGWALTNQRFDDLASSAYSAAAGVYLYHAVRRAYGDGRLGAAARACWLVAAY